jgi:guanine deaminase
MLPVTPTAADKTRQFSGVRGHLVWCADDPADEADALRSETDGIALFSKGKVVAVGPAAELAARYPSAKIAHFPGCMIFPGFVDAHIHCVQTDVIASPANGLLPWLKQFTFPNETRYSDPAVATESAKFFIDQLLRNGTTTAAVYGSVHRGATDALMDEALAKSMRLVAGKSLMDRNAPPELLDRSASQGVRDAEAQIAKWHRTNRLGVALTVRFAGTSTPEQLNLCGELLQRYPDVWLQTHVAENLEEIAWIMGLFPGHRSYLDIYRRFGLLRPRSVMAHCIHFDDDDWACMRDTGATVASCPTSNFFLGSGVYDHARARAAGVTTALGTDVGGGTSFSMLTTMHSAYTAARMRGLTLEPAQLLYHATLGGARALGLQKHIGQIQPGFDADLTVLDPQANPLLARRIASAGSLEEALFGMIVLGDDRIVKATIVDGNLAYGQV